MKEKGYWFKINKTNNEKYLQIWKDDEYLVSCGNAEKLFNKLMKLKELLKGGKR